MRYLLISIFAIGLTFSQNKIVYLLSTTKSLSTVTFRAFENRDDFVGFHEPTLPLSGVSFLDEYLSDKWVENRYHSFEELKKDIYQAQQDSNVVIKDVSFTSYPSLSKDDAFMRNEDVHFVFIVRNFYKVMGSLYSANGFVNDTYYHLADVKLLYELYERAKELSPNKVQLLFIDDLLENPEKTLGEVFDGLEMPFSQKSISWESLGDSFSGKRWHEQKNKQTVQYWHKVAIHSTHFKLRQREPLPERNLFDYAKSEEDRKKLLEIYNFFLPYYLKLLEERK